MQARIRRSAGAPPPGVHRSVPRALSTSFAQGAALPPSSAIALVLNAIVRTTLAPHAAATIRGRVIALHVEGLGGACRIVLTRRGFAPRGRGARADLRLQAGAYDLYLLARGLVGLDELLHAQRVAIAGSVEVRDALIRVLATGDWAALPAGVRHALDGLARLHLRWQH